MRRLLSWATVFCVSITGCATLPILSSGQVGCPSEEIQIANDEQGWATRTWTAECRGKLYYCTAFSSGQQGSTQVACKEKADSAPATAPTPMAAPAPASPVSSGCQYDTQCKGERVCRSGRCEDPAPR